MSPDQLVGKKDFCKNMALPRVWVLFEWKNTGDVGTQSCVEMTTMAFLELAHRARGILREKTCLFRVSIESLHRDAPSPLPCPTVACPTPTLADVRHVSDSSRVATTSACSSGAGLSGALRLLHRTAVHDDDVDVTWRRRPTSLSSSSTRRQLLRPQLPGSR